MRISLINCNNIGILINKVEGYEYDGEWNQDMKHGEGIFKYDSGFIYQGNF